MTTPGQGSGWTGQPGGWGGSGEEPGQPQPGQPDVPPAGGPPAPPQGYPPAPHGYPPAPHGYPPSPPQGFPQAPPPYGGYGQAPQPPGGWGTPPTLERPVTVRAGLGAYIAGLILGLIAVVYEAFNFDEVLANATARLNEQQSQAVSQLGPDFEHTIQVVSLVVGIVFLLLEALFVWFAWQGRNWARIVLWVLAGLAVVSGLASFSSSALPGFLRGMSIFQWILSLVAIVLLSQKPSNEWYRFRKWQRLTGQR
jgi:hypothetical protein